MNRTNYNKQSNQDQLHCQENKKSQAHFCQEQEKNHLFWAGTLSWPGSFSVHHSFTLLQLGIHGTQPGMANSQRGKELGKIIHSIVHDTTEHRGTQPWHWIL